MSVPLFRSEVLHARRRSWLGGISLVQPLPPWLLTGFAVAAATAIVLFLALGEYTRRSRVSGQLVPDLGLATVVAPVDGVVRQAVPEEGERVVRGRPLVVIATPRVTTGSGDTTAGLLSGIEAQRTGVEQGFASRSALLDVQGTGYRRQLEAARQELDQVGSAIGIREEQVAIANDLLAHYRRLAERGYVSRVTVTQQQQASLELTAGLTALQRQATALRRNIAELERVLHELPAQQSAQAAAKMRELADLNRQRLQIEASGEVLVQAPISGLVATRLVKAGQAVQAGQPLFCLLPSGSKLQAQLLVPSRAIGFIEPGDAVVLRYDAFPHEKFGHRRGTVLRISRNALGPEGLGTLVGNPLAGEPYYKVMVTLSEQSIVVYGRREALRPGMLVEADILGDRRKLYEWLLEPLYSLSGRF